MDERKIFDTTMQNIADSSGRQPGPTMDQAKTASQLLFTVYQMRQAGKSEAEVVAYLESEAQKQITES